RIGAAHSGGLGVGVPLVVGGVVGAVGLVQLTEAGHDVLHRGVGGQVEDQRLDLGTQEVVRAGSAELGQRGQLLPREELQHHACVGEVTHLRGVGGGQAADHRRQGGSL